MPEDQPNKSNNNNARKITSLWGFLSYIDARHGITAMMLSVTVVALYVLVALPFREDRSQDRNDRQTLIAQLVKNAETDVQSRIADAASRDRLAQSFERIALLQAEGIKISAESANRDKQMQLLISQTQAISEQSNKILKGRDELFHDAKLAADAQVKHSAAAEGHLLGLKMESQKHTVLLQEIRDEQKAVATALTKKEQSKP
jgi:hypothetical protein